MLGTPRRGKLGVSVRMGGWWNGGEVGGNRVGGSGSGGSLLGRATLKEREVESDPVDNGA